jgi:hypothetical protein
VSLGGVKRPRERLKVRVESERPVDVVRETVRQLSPGSTDEEIIEGLRELADLLEAEIRSKVAG